MREITAAFPRPAVRPTVEALKKRFKIWRKKGGAGNRIPDALWKAAVELCRDHSVSKVSRDLRLNYNDLKERVHKTKEVELESDLGFVKLDLAAPLVSPTDWRVEMEAPNGAKMTLSLKGAPRDLNPLELSRAFWSQGR